MTINRNARISLAILAAIAVAAVTAMDLHDGHRLRAARDFALGFVFVAAALRLREA